MSLIIAAVAALPTVLPSPAADLVEQGTTGIGNVQEGAIGLAGAGLGALLVFVLYRVIARAVASRGRSIG